MGDKRETKEKKRKSQLNSPHCTHRPVVIGLSVTTYIHFKFEIRMHADLACLEKYVYNFTHE